MTINRFNPRADPNQKDVIKGLEAAGYEVFVLRRPCDLLIGKDGLDWKIEVKQPGKEKELTKFQKDHFKNWPGARYIIATSAEDALNQIHGFKL